MAGGGQHLDSIHCIAFYSPSQSNPLHQTQTSVFWLNIVPFGHLNWRQGSNLLLFVLFPVQTQPAQAEQCFGGYDCSSCCCRRRRRRRHADRELISAMRCEGSFAQLRPSLIVLARQRSRSAAKAAPFERESGTIKRIPTTSRLIGSLCNQISAPLSSAQIFDLPRGCAAFITIH